MAAIAKYDLSVILNDFSQKQFEAFQMGAIVASRDSFVAFNSSTHDGVSATAMVRGQTVRKAIETGILTGITVEQVDGLKPYVVAWLADEVQKHVKFVTTAPVDPN